jgi:predicted phage-related endonuclease
MTIILISWLIGGTLVAWVIIRAIRKGKRLRKEMDDIYKDALRKTGGGKSGIKKFAVWKLREHNLN